MSFYLTSRSRPAVKPTRNTPRVETRFGKGLLAAVPHYGRQPYNTADLEWAAQNFSVDADAEPSDAEFDEMAAEFAWERRLEGAYLASVELGGHCAACGLRDDFLNANALCPPCALANAPVLN